MEPTWTKCHAVTKCHEVLEDPGRSGATLARVAALLPLRGLDHLRHDLAAALDQRALSRAAVRALDARF